MTVISNDRTAATLGGVATAVLPDQTILPWGVVKHEPNVVDVLPWILELASVESDGGQIHRFLDDVKVVGDAELVKFERIAEWNRLGVSAVKFL